MIRPARQLLQLVDMIRPARQLPQLVDMIRPARQLPQLVDMIRPARQLPQLVIDSHSQPAPHSHITLSHDTAKSQDQSTTCIALGTPQDIYLWPAYHRRKPKLMIPVHDNTYLTRRSIRKRVRITRWPAQAVRVGE